MSKEYNEVTVWDLSYALQDEEGNYKHDSKGNVEVYDYPDEDCQNIAEYIKPEDLKKREPVIKSNLIEEIRNICSANVGVDWLENDASKEFAQIIKLIDEDVKDISLPEGWEQGLGFEIIDGVVCAKNNKSTNKKA